MIGLPPLQPPPSLDGLFAFWLQYVTSFSFVIGYKRLNCGQECGIDCKWLDYADWKWWWKDILSLQQRERENESPKVVPILRNGKNVSLDKIVFYFDMISHSSYQEDIHREKEKENYYYYYYCSLLTNKITKTNKFHLTSSVCRNQNPYYNI